ncbi:hypothetical protein ACH4CC_27330 [Streptomyces lydicus]|uniref:hypothetical protein n=1 Tax=Streptomyces lydicus TaxID=47763 RepID=UPI0037ACD873
MSRWMADGEDARHEMHLWVGEIPEALRELRTEELAEEFPFDFSVGSLEALEAHLLAEYPSAGSKVGMESRRAFCATMYLGEVLMTVAGGTWGWNRRKGPGAPMGQPVVCPDPALDLRPVAPLLLIAHAMRTRTGDAFSREVARLRAAVAEVREREPGWEPVVVLPAEEVARKAGTDHPELVAWLDRRGAAFPGWAAEAGAPERWDFGLDSLELLEEIVRERFADGEEILAEKRSEFVQGAVWYIGEVVRRNARAVEWQYQPRGRFGELAGIPWADVGGCRAGSFRRAVRRAGVGKCWGCACGGWWRPG